MLPAQQHLLFVIQLDSCLSRSALMLHRCTDTLPLTAMPALQIFSARWEKVAHTAKGAPATTCCDPPPSPCAPTSSPTLTQHLEHRSCQRVTQALYDCVYDQLGAVLLLTRHNSEQHLRTQQYNTAQHDE